MSPSSTGLRQKKQRRLPLPDEHPGKLIKTYPEKEWHRSRRKRSFGVHSFFPPFPLFFPYFALFDFFFYFPFPILPSFAKSLLHNLNFAIILINEHAAGDAAAKPPSAVHPQLRLTGWADMAANTYYRIEMPDFPAFPFHRESGGRRPCRNMA